MARITKTVPERRQEIIETARALFTEYGFDKTQIADISKRMNVAQGLVYHYFKPKTEILYAVIDEMAEEKKKALDTALNGTEGTAFQRLTTLLSIKMNADGFGQLIPSIVSDTAIVEYCSNKITTSAMPMLLSIIKQGNFDGSWNCEYPEETALFILRGFSGFFDIAGTSNDKPETKQAIFSIIVRVLGLLPNSEDRA